MKFGFFAFTPGLPGIALVLLRVSLAVSLVQCALAESQPRWMVGLALVALGLAFGIWTRATAFAAAALCGWQWVGAGTNLSDHHLSTMLDAMALMLIGPGAFSIDAKRFGRRTVHVAE